MEAIQVATCLYISPYRNLCLFVKCCCFVDGAPCAANMKPHYYIAFDICGRYKICSWAALKCFHIPFNKNG